MKMSDAMQICYGGHPQLEPLIEEQIARENMKPKSDYVTKGTLDILGLTQKSLQPAQPQYPDFPFSIQRDFSDEPIELAIQVKHYRQGTVLKPGQYMSERDPAFDPGEVSFGDAVVVSTGTTIELTPQEWQTVEEAFWGEIHG